MDAVYYTLGYVIFWLWMAIIGVALLIGLAESLVADPEDDYLEGN